MTLTEILNKAERIVGLYLPKDKARTAILAEAHDKLGVIVKAIDDFVQTKPTRKGELYDFLDKTYAPLCTYAYNQWYCTENIFEDIIMSAIQEEHKIDEQKFKYLYDSPNIQLMLHNLVWSEFTSPLRDKLWKLPRVPRGDAAFTLADQLRVLQSCKHKLETMLSDINT